MIKSDRERSAKLRRITLDESIKVMESTPTDNEARRFKEALHLRLAGNLLPRINEHTGENGESIKHQFEWKQEQSPLTTPPDVGLNNSTTASPVG